MEDSGSLRLRLLICIVLAIITFAAFYQVIGHDFLNYDDDIYVTTNRWVQHGLTLDSVKWAFSSVYAATWQPMVWLSYMVDGEVFGLKAWGYHLANLLMHMANVLLLFLLFQRMTGKPWRSAFVALLFAVHPLHVESVAWIAERKDVLSTLFMLLTMWAYVGYAKHGGVRKYLWVMLFFVLGLMAKPMLVSLPFVLLLMDYWPLGRFPSGSHGRAQVVGRLIWEKVPLLAVVCASSALTVIAQRAGGALVSSDVYGLGVRGANAVVSYVGYLVKTVRPVGLAIPYLHPGSTLPTWQVVASLIVLVAISGLVLTRGRRYPFLLVGWLWYIVTLIPVIGLVQIGWQGMADRFTYTPLIGLFLAVAWGFPDICEYLGRKADGGSVRASGMMLAKYVPVVAAVSVSVALIGCTRVQVGYWKNSVTLFAHTLKVTGDNSIAYSNLGSLYFRMKQYDKAVVYYRKALSGQEGQASFHSDLANALYETKSLQEAVEQYSKTLRIDPEYPHARNNLAVALAELTGRQKRGSSSRKDDPGYQKAVERVRLAMELNAQNRLDEAISELEAAISLAPDLAEAHCDLGVVLGRRGDNERAILECREAIRLEPGFAQAHMNLALGLSFARDYAGAWREVHLAQKYGGTPAPRFLEYLATKMPEPSE